ncbi:acetate-CoA ligase [Allomyces macrogynus ATCC 38327]|uniref:Acetyl-coenzyme A synthetase n=1 Tax=Allomyces macrogynus (strain ATCC 38327) TaxID=578462 RepID=A0A0L0RWG4_ALLM3|nr:acetate-CoA ligase [Allomyces macrogynus ATCC 38327]|eukprot:KNE54416.1 acetate-CoA ligase [Allomyces macrogynus ATCC 38327]
MPVAQPASATGEHPPGAALVGTKYVKVPKNDPSQAKEANDAPKFPIAPRMTADKGRVPHVASTQQYLEMWQRSVDKPAEFFAEQARELLSWMTPFSVAHHGDLHHGDASWFLDGTLNASYICVDRHAFATPDKVAIIYEADHPDRPHVEITYRELLRQVCQLAGALHAQGLRKGDAVGIYLPNTAHAVVAMLACARLGLVHSVIFAGFSAEALRDRLRDCQCKVLITADQGMRAGKEINIKSIADEALREAPMVQKVIVHKRTGNPNVKMDPTRDIYWDEAVKSHRPYCPPVPMAAEDPLFMLYTSGSTGKPKGLMHTTAGYLLGAALSTKYVFDVHEGDKFACVADVGWITGHSYIVYGPLALGTTTLVFEGVPTWPEPDMYWRLIQKHKLTQFYTSPTALRALRKFGDEPVKKYDLTSVRVLGSVGEPIDPNTWMWLHDVVGKGEAAIVDTYWQTETGAHVLTPLPGAIETKPGSATVPFFGVRPAILDPQTGEELEGNDVSGVLAFKQAWPSMARTVFGDHDRYLETYVRPYPGYYFTGDGCTRDHDGYLWIKGRVDDVINNAGHRLSVAEIESALTAHETCAEAAVVGAPDEIAGQCVIAFVTLKHTHIPTSEIPALLTYAVRRSIGPIATPKRIIIVPDLPKTRSGKVMRRILRKIVANETDSLGDLSTLSDPSVVQTIIDLHNNKQ